MTKQISEFKTGEDWEAFIEGDLSDLDFSSLRPIHFEFSKKTAQINMRVPEALLTEVKLQSSARGVPYTRFIGEAIEQALARRPAGQSAK